MISMGVPLPSMFLSYQWDTGSFVWGGGGGGGVFCSDTMFFMFCLSLFCFRCFGFSSL